METKIPYEKTFKTPEELVNVLQSRGLLVPNIEAAINSVSNIGYYRLSAYMYPLLQIPKKEHRYKAGASFNKVMMLYRFDKKLRVFIFNEIEKIEIAIRAAIVDCGCEFFTDPFWMTNQVHFKDVKKFNHTMELIESELNHSREDFIVHFKQKYIESYPPAWILSEILPLGVISSLYSNIKDIRLKKSIAQRFGLQRHPFESWLTIVTLTRNACCHHARIWNKQNSIRPMMPNHTAYPWVGRPIVPVRIFFNLCIIKYFVNIISPENDMGQKLKTLLSNYPEVDTSAMGFPQGWEEEPVWNSTVVS
ncbi:MAG: Abi family protein [Bacteroidales bacterium]|nr:Abi family protein [Bacteroidales bacterium]